MHFTLGHFAIVLPLHYSSEEHITNMTDSYQADGLAVPKVVLFSAFDAAA
jgi:hypothetical protein